ncbi:MAG: hypothetical protein JRM74_02385 [Nitrososphaerota archaeon]|nr:hypothetical protein [Nitrososphaerota archaeon]MDG6956238.1 hypothetical protein [Nitrososphaerota archaeon]MDG6959750.1 hypothetical protein [Nitrososphaerota archaeon]MDG6968168.1 hypothetical protein [Nitrososphaerota archaeon]MDG6973773.1 hypothetical protein [Nitrososphaerota archaeon]
MNWRMKQRFLAMGGIISVLSLGLMAARGADAPLEGLFGLGLVLLLLGALWKKS